VAFVTDEWRQILKIIAKHQGKQFDLIALPEYVVPFGTYSFLYPYEYVKKSFAEIFGPSAISKLPPREEPFASQRQTFLGNSWFVNNAFWSQAIANIFDTEVIAGLEDADERTDGIFDCYSAAIHFTPGVTADQYAPTRYAKRVLLPMAEYIPFSFCQELAAHYGIQGSFTPGNDATVLKGSVCPFSVSICYEETFGQLMNEGRRNGAELLVNLTSDVWYPNSRLPQQHASHARLRTVESGIPLLRACNTGVTSAYDSLGRCVAVLGDGGPDSEWLADALDVKLPRYHYETIYSRTGDSAVIGFCFVALSFLFYRRKK
jgi:apolipoprotein N-acyltransferase